MGREERGEEEAEELDEETEETEAGDTGREEERSGLSSRQSRAAVGFTGLVGCGCCSTWSFGLRRVGERELAGTDEVAKETAAGGVAGQRGAVEAARGALVALSVEEWMEARGEN